MKWNLVVLQEHVTIHMASNKIPETSFLLLSQTWKTSLDCFKAPVVMTAEHFRNLFLLWFLYLDWRFHTRSLIDPFFPSSSPRIPLHPSFPVSGEGACRGWPLSQNKHTTPDSFSPRPTLTHQLPARTSTHRSSSPPFIPLASRPLSYCLQLYLSWFTSPPISSVVPCFPFFF